MKRLWSHLAPTNDIPNGFANALSPITSRLYGDVLIQIHFLIRRYQTIRNFGFEKQGRTWN